MPRGFWKGTFKLLLAVAVPLTVAVTAFLVSMMRTDMLPAVPYVDQILFTAFDVHILAGAAVWLGALLLLVAPILGWRGSSLCVTS